MIFLEKVHNQLALSVIKPPEINSDSLGIGSYWVLGGLSSLLKSEVKHRVIGLDKNKDKALCKAISGYVEMLAKVSQNKESDSDKHYRLHEGYAAYPALYPSGLEKCQENAYFEALEGFVWDSFWEDSSYGYTSEFYVDDLAKYLGFEFCKMICPKINSDIVVAFAVGKVDAKGIVVTCEYFQSAGIRVLAVIPTTWTHRDPHQQILKKLEEQGVLVSAPSRDDDDAYAITIARREDAKARERGDGPGYVMSNDMFRDAIARTEEEGGGEGLKEWLTEGSTLEQGKTGPGRISFAFLDTGSMDDHGDKVLDIMPSPRHPLIQFVEQSRRKA